MTKNTIKVVKIILELEEIQERIVKLNEDSAQREGILQSAYSRIGLAIEQLKTF